MGSTPCTTSTATALAAAAAAAAASGADDDDDDDDDYDDVATMPWSGDRLLVMGYHIRSPRLVPTAAVAQLLALGFKVFVGR